MTDFAVFSQTRIFTFFKGRIYFFVFSVFSVAHQILLTDRTGVICFFLATQVPDKIKRYFACAMSESKSMFWKQRMPRWSTFIKCVTSVFALTSWHLFRQRSKAFLKILETIEIYLGAKMTSNTVFVTYERSTCRCGHLAFYTRVNSFFAENLVPQRFWEREPIVLCNGSHDHRKWGENGKVCGRKVLKMDYSIITTSENITFLVLWQLWANYFAGVAANHWNVDHVLLCVHETTSWLQNLILGFGLCVQVSFYLFSLYI